MCPPARPLTAPHHHPTHEHPLPHHPLQHLPVYQHNKEGFSGDAQLINSGERALGQTKPGPKPGEKTNALPARLP